MTPPLEGSRAALQTLKARAVRFRKARPPILIFGLRRGGTTLLADLYAGLPGVWFADEPFAVLPSRRDHAFKAARLPEAEHSHFFALKGEDLRRFEAFSRGLLAARFPQLGTCRRTLPVLRADQVCLKILNAPWMIDWFAEKTDAQIVVMLRHPAAQALSVLRQGWEFPVRAYLNRPEDLAGELTSAQIALAADLLRDGTPWQIAILDWAVTSRRLRDRDDGRVRRVLYEEVVADPGLLDGLGLSTGSRPDAAAALRRPSGSRRMNESATDAAIARGDTAYLNERWREGVDEAMRDQANRILEAFEVREYRL